jgi:hypothetical protein
MRDPDVRPFVDHDGVPLCNRDGCPMYDGKRCRALGYRPDGICEPRVREMAAELKRKETPDAR